MMRGFTDAAGGWPEHSRKRGDDNAAAAAQLHHYWRRPGMTGAQQQPSRLESGRRCRCSARMCFLFEANTGARQSDRTAPPHTHANHPATAATTTNIQQQPGNHRRRNKTNPHIHGAYLEWTRAEMCCREHTLAVIHAVRAVASRRANKEAVLTSRSFSRASSSKNVSAAGSYTSSCAQRAG